MRALRPLAVHPLLGRAGGLGGAPDRFLGVLPGKLALPVTLAQVTLVCPTSASRNEAVPDVHPERMVRLLEAACDARCGGSGDGSGAEEHRGGSAVAVRVRRL